MTLIKTNSVSHTKGFYYETYNLGLKYYDIDSEGWIGVVSDWKYRAPYNTDFLTCDHCIFFSSITSQAAVESVIWGCSEGDGSISEEIIGGGLVFSDDSAVGIIAQGEWPSFINDVYPSAESDFFSSQSS